MKDFEQNTKLHLCKIVNMWCVDIFIQFHQSLRDFNFIDRWKISNIRMLLVVVVVVVGIFIWILILFIETKIEPNLILYPAMEWIIHSNDFDPIGSNQITQKQRIQLILIESFFFSDRKLESSATSWILIKKKRKKKNKTKCTSCRVFKCPNRNFFHSFSFI